MPSAEIGIVRAGKAVAGTKIIGFVIVPLLRATLKKVAECAEDEHDLFLVV
jgi:hypothetical protein